MNNKRMMIFMAMTWIAMALFIWQMNGKSGAKNTSKPTTIKQVQKLATEAGTDKKAVGRAISQYKSLAKANSGTEAEAQARLEAARLREEKLHDQNGAIRDYQSITWDFPVAVSAASRQAHDRLSALQHTIDARNREKVGYKAIDWLVALTGRNPKWSFAFALLIITILIKLATLPLTHKQYQSMKEMQKVQPLLKELQAKYKDNQQELGQRMMALYKEHGINPFASCLPLFIQMPVLIGLYYKVILAYQFQFAKGEFLWIGSSLMQHQPAFIKLAGYRIPFAAQNLSMPDLLLLLLYTASMIVSQKLTVVDPTQAEQQKFMAWGMPIIFTVVLASFPSALMLYWLFFNILSTAQQYMVMKAPAKAAPASDAAGPSAAMPQKPRGKSRKR